DGKVLDERYLTKASVSFSQGFAPQVDLLFNADGGKIFAELTKRLLGKQIAIFVGGELLTAPTVQSVIPDGRAVITGNYTAESAKKLSTDINTGIVPAPIYLTSERTIDAKIGADSLRVIINAGLIGLLLIIGFLVLIYRVSGLMAGIALVIYGLILLAIVKSFGIVLTLASIAGIILSIGLAIDANILIFERTKEELRNGVEVEKAIIVGFGKSWSAIWDSHITSFTSAIVLYIFGISLIKGFGLMLGLGILLSLFTAMWISRILILVVGNKMRKKTKCFIGV
ncbi:MAG: protein translocase subunit SecD, partial [Candidatus Gracilibacteria bacterium]